MRFPEEHCSLQEHLLNHPHPGLWPIGTLVPLCESGLECKLNLLHTHNGTFLEHCCLDYFLHTVAQGLLWNNYWNVKSWAVASSTDSLPNFESEVLSGLLPQISMAINVSIHISFKVNFLLAKALYLSPVLSLEMKRIYVGFTLIFWSLFGWFSDWNI